MLLASMVKRSLSPARESAQGEGSLELSPLLKKAAWEELVSRMRIHANVDMEALREGIFRRMAAEPKSETTEARRLFDMMVVRLAILDAAMTNPHNRGALQEVVKQIQERFPREWKKLELGFGRDLAHARRLMDLTKALSESETYGRKPDQITRAFEPVPVGPAPFAEKVRHWPDPDFESGVPATGLDFYKVTLMQSPQLMETARRLDRVLASPPARGMVKPIMRTAAKKAVHKA